MGTLEQLSTLCRIRDILAFFGLEDGAGILAEHGDLVLTLWARDVATLDDLQPDVSDAERLDRYGAALRAAYEAVARPARRGARGWVILEGGASPGDRRRAS
jgi:hypothetical protein